MIAGFWTQFSKATREMMVEGYTGVYNRYRINGWKMPRVHYVDNPPQTQNIIGPLIPSLSDGGKYRSKKYMRFNGLVSVCDTLQKVQSCVSMLCQQLVGPLSPERKAIGLDIEWEYLAALIQSGDSDTTQAPTAIGFATNQCVVIVHTCRLGGVLPDAFKDLLKDPGIVKVGAALAGDCTRIEKFFDVKVEPQVDVLKQARDEITETTTGEWSLHAVCDTVLKNKMCKDTELRCSFVNSALVTLDEDQKQYLALDCVVPLLLYQLWHGWTTSA